MGISKGKSLNIKYGAMQGFYWMIYCAIPGFASVFLLDKQYDNTQIGYILAIGFIVSVFLQPIVADIADKSKKISLVGIMMINVIALILFGGVIAILPGKSIALTAVYIFFVIGIMILQPLVNALSFYLEKMGVHINFGVTRSMGSLFFSIICVILGYAIEIYGSVVLPLSAVIVLILVLGILISLDRNRKMYLADENDNEIHSKKHKNEEKQSLLQFAMKYKRFFIFLAGGTGLFFGHTIINNFFYQIIQNVGGDSTDLGKIQSFCAIMELPTMMMFDKIRRKTGCKQLLNIAAVFFSIKIIITLLAGNVGLLYVSAVLQSVSFAIFIPASVHYVDELMEKSDAVKGQALLTGMIALANVLSSLLGGVVLDNMSVVSMLVIGTTVSVTGTVVGIYGINER